MSVKKLKIKPVADRVVIKVEEKEQVTAGGIIIPVTAAPPPNEAEVIAVGKGRVDENGVRHPIDVKVGDTVVFNQYAGTEFELQGEKFKILMERDLLAVRTNVKGRA